MRIHTRIKASPFNHGGSSGGAMKIKTRIKAGAISEGTKTNHNQTRLTIR